MRRRWAIAAGVGLLALAYAVTATTPGQPLVEAPFPVSARLGEEATARKLAVTVNEVTLADVVEVGDWRGTTAGIWLAGELTVRGILVPAFASLEVQIDGVRYPATRRVDSSDTVIGTTVAAGFAITGPFAVELPADILERPGARTAVVRITEGLDARLDSAIDLAIDLTTLEHLDVVGSEPVRDGIR